MGAEHGDDYRELVEKVRGIYTALLGEVKPGGAEGLIPTVKRHDRALRALQRFGWVVLGALVMLGVATCAQNGAWPWH